MQFEEFLEEFEKDNKTMVALISELTEKLTFIRRKYIDLGFKQEYFDNLDEFQIANLSVIESNFNSAVEKLLEVMTPNFDPN